MPAKTFTLPAGTICKRGGIPFMLMNATLIECHPGNWPLIRDGFKTGVSLDRLDELVQLDADKEVANAKA